MTVLQIIPTYLYQQYADDDDLQSFIAAWNQLAQSYLDWFNHVPIPVYTSPYITGSLLDWIAEGLYGISRPVLPYGATYPTGVPNTFVPNELAPNSSSQPYTIYGAIGSFAIGVSPIEGYTSSGANDFATTDDTFKRVITWLFYKGDGKAFNVRWLKRRIKRFLEGANGTDPGINETYDIRVIFGNGSLVNIVLLGGTVTVPINAVPNEGVPGSFVPNGGPPVYSTNRGAILRAGIETGVLELPYEYRYAVYG